MKSNRFKIHIPFAFIALSCGQFLAASAYETPYGPQQPQSAQEPRSVSIDLVSFANSPEQRFVQPDANRLPAARTKLQGAMARLEQYLKPLGTNGADWLSYLNWEDLKNEVGKDTSGGVRTLRRILQLFRANHPGLERTSVRNVADALEEYADALETAKTENLEERFNSYVKQLQELIGKLGQHPTTADMEKLGLLTGWMKRHRQVPKLVDRLTRRYSNPNIVVHVSEDFVRNVSVRPVDEVSPLHEWILGTEITGTGHTIGLLTVEVLPDRDGAARLKAVMSGTNYSKTVGHNGPAIIYSNGATQLTGTKLLRVTKDGVTSFPATSHATTHTNVTGIGSTRRGLLGRIVRRVASRKIPQQKAQGEAIASRKAEMRLNAKFDETTRPEVEKVNATLRDKLLMPLDRLDLMPRTMDFSSTEDTFQIKTLLDDEFHMAAPTLPPRVSGKAQVLVRMHESALTNMFAKMFGGKTLGQDETERLATELLGRVPQELEVDKNRETGTITFASHQPITVQFSSDELALTIHGQRFTHGNREFDAMNVTVRYHLERIGPNAKAVRRGEVEVYPPGFVPGQGKTIPLRLTVLRNLLLERFNKVFPAELHSDGLTFTKKLKDVGTLQFTVFDATDGWISVGFNRIPPGQLASKRAPNQR